ncbi:MAG: DNA alkylation repair protein [Asgard group archaeon]|nr:DNA alkylation repair protein [Asgard group archaeon]
MAKFGITPEKTFGVRIPNIKNIAKKIGKDPKLAKELWEINTRETRILACMIEDPKIVSEKQIDDWVKEFDYWEICDQCIMTLIDKTPFAQNKCFEWTERDEEFVKRAGFSLIARLAWTDKNLKDDTFIEFLSLIEREATDDRNAVKKAVNWALRQIGKRNLRLNQKAIKSARKILSFESKTAKWVANDALRELTDEKIKNKLKNEK